MDDFSLETFEATNDSNGLNSDIMESAIRVGASAKTVSLAIKIRGIVRENAKDLENFKQENPWCRRKKLEKEKSRIEHRNAARRFIRDEYNPEDGFAPLGEYLEQSSSSGLCHYAACKTSEVLAKIEACVTTEYDKNTTPGKLASLLEEFSIAEKKHSTLIQEDPPEKEYHTFKTYYAFQYVYGTLRGVLDKLDMGDGEYRGKPIGKHKENEE